MQIDLISGQLHPFVVLKYFGNFSLKHNFQDVMLSLLRSGHFL